MFLVISAALSVSFVGAQNNSEFNGIIKKISESKTLTAQEKDDIIDEAIDLHYDEGVDLDQITNVLDQNDNYKDIEDQFQDLDDQFDKDGKDENDDWDDSDDDDNGNEDNDD